METDRGRSHCAPAECVHAACKYVKLVQPISKQSRKAEHAALYTGMDFC